jgi:4,5-DOPA dioxygenase extradiol
MTRLPTVFISHGAPTFAVEPGVAGALLGRLGQALPRPRAVLVLSPHWMTRGLAIQSSAAPATVHDFGGFPEPLYRLRYPAPGAPDVAADVRAALARHGIDARLDAAQGFDHGTWVPLLHLLPAADVPVLQLSLPAGATAEDVHALGAAVAPLRDTGVLVVGSGSITHNLRDAFGRSTDVPPPGYAQAFVDWTVDALRDGRVDDLLAWSSRAPHAARAHPTDEHLLPLFFAIGAAGNAVRDLLRLEGGLHSAVPGGEPVVGMDSFVFGADAALRAAFEAVAVPMAVAS